MITFTLDFTGTPDRDDRDAALLLIEEANERRALEDPPVDPLPFGTPAELKASYLELGVTVVTHKHQGLVLRAADKKKNEADVAGLWRDATDAQRTAAITSLTT